MGLDERFCNDIEPTYEGDDPFAAEAHKELISAIVANNQAKNYLARAHQIALDDRHAPTVRMNVLIRYLFGRDTRERFDFELKWQEAIKQNLDDTLEAIRASQGSKELHIPGQGIHLVPPPKGENGAGADSDPTS